MENQTENQTGMERLNEKVTQVIKEYHELQESIGALKTEVMTLKAQSDEKDKEIARLEDENGIKDLEIEEIVKKIESIIA